MKKCARALAGANRKKFLIIKREGEATEDPIAVPLGTDEAILKYAQDRGESVEALLRENVFSVGARNIP
jgi:hypothetical protein